MLNNTVKYAPHALALMFPRPTKQEADDLGEHIQKFTLQEPVILFEGQVLDGVTRQEQCALRGVPCRYIEFMHLNPEIVEAGPFEYVIGHNAKRRHLTQSQLAAVAADALQYYEAQAAKRKAATQFKGGEAPRSAPFGANRKPEGKSAAQVAKVTGASTRMVERAKRLQKESPAKFEKVKRGEVTLSKAERDKAKTDAMKQSRTAAIERISKLGFKDLADAVEKGVLLKTHKDLVAFAEQDDEDITRQAGLIEIGWPFKKAQLFRAKHLTLRHTLQDLADRAASEGFSLSIDIDGWRFDVRRANAPK